MVAMHIQCNWFPAFFVLAVATIHYTNVLCWSQHKPSSILASHGVFCSSRFNNYDSGQQCVIHFFLPIIKWLCSTNKPTFTIILNRRTFASSFVFVQTTEDYDDCWVMPLHVCLFMCSVYNVHTLFCNNFFDLNMTYSKGGKYGWELFLPRYTSLK